MTAVAKAAKQSSTITAMTVHAWIPRNKANVRVHARVQTMLVMAFVTTTTTIAAATGTMVTAAETVEKANSTIIAQVVNAEIPSLQVTGVLDLVGRAITWAMDFVTITTTIAAATGIMVTVAEIPAKRNSTTIAQIARAWIRRKRAPAHVALASTLAMGFATITTTIAVVIGTMVTVAAIVAKANSTTIAQSARAWTPICKRHHLPKLQTLLSFP